MLLILRHTTCEHAMITQQQNKATYDDIATTS